MREAKLGDFLAKRSRGIVPASTPTETFELYSVPAFETKRPEVVTGTEIGSNKQVVEPGTVLLCKINPRINRAWTVGSFTKHRKIASTEWITFPPHPGLEPRYLANYLSRKEIRDYLAANASGVGGSLMRVKASTIDDLPLPLPNLAEQRRIVAELEKQFSRLDEAVANLKRVKANLPRQKLATFAAATSGRLMSESSAPFEVSNVDDRHTELPSGWCWAEIGELADVVRGGSPRPAGDPRYFGGPIPWITVGPITADDDDYLRSVPTGLTEAGRERSRYIQPHTLLLTNSGATLGVPKISLIGGCINDGVAALLNVEYPLKKYLLVYLRSKTAEMRRVNQGAAQPNLNTTIIKRHRVPIPPTDEQNRIVAEVDRRLSIVREVEAGVDANIRRAQALRQAVLARHFQWRS
jgi:type I restriction enzyme S subunit